MSRRQLFPTIAVLAALGTGCQERKTNDAADTQAGSAVSANAAGASVPASNGFDMPEVTAGHLRLADAELFFLPCGRTGDSMKLDDGTNGEAFRMMRVANAPAAGLVSLVRLDGNRLLQVRYASSEAKCRDLPSPATVEASGNEPFWGVLVEGDKATFRTPYNLPGVVYQGGKWTRLDSARWKFTARSNTERVAELSLELVEARCMDTMAVAMFPLSVRLVRGDSILTGCAVEGRGSFPRRPDSTTSASPPRARQQARSPLWGTAWRLAEVNGARALDNPKATLEFASGGKVSGNSSCNRFSGTVEAVADSLRFGALISTRMACPDAVMHQERAYLEALGNAERYERQGNSMLVHVKGSAKPLRFEPL